MYRHHRRRKPLPHTPQRLRVAAAQRPTRPWACPYPTSVHVTAIMQAACRPWGEAANVPPHPHLRWKLKRYERFPHIHKQAPGGGATLAGALAQHNSTSAIQGVIIGSPLCCAPHPSPHARPDHPSLARVAGHASAHPLGKGHTSPGDPPAEPCKQRRSRWTCRACAA